MSSLQDELLPFEVDYDSDEEPPVAINFQELRRRAGLAVSRTCTDIRLLTKGRYHEIFLLSFDNSDDPTSHNTPLGNGADSVKEWNCIARVSRQPECIKKLISEMETMEYVRLHTSIPVPEVYSYDFDVRNSVSAQFMLMERKPGLHLYRIWDKLSLEHKKVAISEIARVQAELSKLKFEEIGTLTSDGRIGPLIYCMGDELKGLKTTSGGPFKSTLDYLLHFLNLRHDGTKDFEDVGLILKSHLANLDNSPHVNSPFRLIHADLDGQNILFTGGLPSSDSTDSVPPPRLSAVLDWEWAYTGPVHYLYKFPMCIRDCDDNVAAYSDNAILRPHFVRALRQFFPKESPGRIEVNASIKDDYMLNYYHFIFFTFAGAFDSETVKNFARLYVANVHDGTKEGYYDRFDYSSDGDVPSDSEGL